MEVEEGGEGWERRDESFGFLEIRCALIEVMCGKSSST